MKIDLITRYKILIVFGLDQIRSSHRGAPWSQAGGVYLPRQLLDRKEYTKHGFLTIEVELVRTGKAALYFLA